MWARLLSPNTSQEFSPKTGTEAFHFQYPFVSAKSRALKKTTWGWWGSGLLRSHLVKKEILVLWIFTGQLPHSGNQRKGKREMCLHDIINICIVHIVILNFEKYSYFSKLKFRSQHLPLFEIIRANRVSLTSQWDRSVRGNEPLILWAYPWDRTYTHPLFGIHLLLSNPWESSWPHYILLKG